MSQGLGVLEACVEKDVLTEDDLWGQHSPSLWRAETFRGPSYFYPVYQFEEYYSYSILELIQLKRRLVLDPDVYRQVQNDNFLYCPPDRLIDQEIRRIGGPIPNQRRLRSQAKAIAAIAKAMVADIARVETKHSGFTNFILCGGKDSLNLLLLPWQNPTVVVSAAPNFPLVRQFIRDNRLELDVVELVDGVSDEEKDLVALANGCRMTLKHLRWVSSLRSLAAQQAGMSIFWGGGMGDSFLTPYWKSYRCSARNHALFGLTQKPLSSWPWSKRCGDERMFETCWHEGAAFQGVSLGVMREVTSTLVLSAYFGPEMLNVLTALDVPRVVTEDIRPRLGQQLLGRPVIYPSTNPRPPVSEVWNDYYQAPRFLDLLKDQGIEVVASDTNTAFDQEDRFDRN